MRVETRSYLATDFHNLNISAFDAVNLPLPREESQSQFIVSRGGLTSLIPNSDISLPSGVKDLASEEVVSTTQPRKQSQLTFGSLPILSATVTTSQAGEVREDRLRCAVCTKALCNRPFRCPGSGKRELCICGHPPLRKGERVRLSENRIRELILLRD